ncbi:MAG TPA: hypothetical protein VK843_00840 [Planctomycetota bacterium]|nr:hypothetical protein [Planctomycetota bacterium]
MSVLPFERETKAMRVLLRITGLYSSLTANSLRPVMATMLSSAVSPERESNSGVRPGSSKWNAREVGSGEAECGSNSSGCDWQLTAQSRARYEMLKRVFDMAISE